MSRLKLFRTKLWPGVMVTTIAVTIILSCASGDAAPIAVKFREGMTHGYLLVRAVDGQIIGQGEATKVLKDGDLVESRLVFHFKDGSLHDESVAYSQKRMFTMIRYHLIQRGAFFPKQMDVTVDRGTGDYTVRTQEENKQEEVLEGNVVLPKDVYNGMVVTILTNLPKGTSETVGWLVFMPEPQIIPLHLRLVGEEQAQIGQKSTVARRYTFEPEIGTLKKLLGKIIGAIPGYFRYDCWILTDDVPSFVQFEGRLQVKAPVVRIELISQRLALNVEDR